MARRFSIQELRELLRYDPESGKLYWLERGEKWFAHNKRPAIHCARAWNNKHAGREALIFVDPDTGYLYGKIFTENYLAHRVIWFLVTGEWPDEIDHENGDKGDNRWVNIRDVTRLENAKNVRKSTENPLKHYGVNRYRNGKFRAHITVNNEHKHLGYFASFEDALQRRKEAEIEYGFHANHQFRERC